MVGPFPMSNSFLRSSDAPPVTARSAQAAPVLGLVLSAWGLLSCWDVHPFGIEIGAPLTALLLRGLGEEGVKPGRELVEGVLLMTGILSVFWLLILRRTLWQPHDPYMAEMVQDMKGATTTLLVFLTSLVATTVLLVRLAFGGPGSWMDDTFGPPALGIPGLLALAALTAVLGLLLRHVHRRLKHHPVYGKEPRPR